MVMEKIDSKGLETVRRDNSGIVKMVLNPVINYIMVEQDISKAIKHTQDVIRQLYRGEIDISQLIISKTLAKADYAGKQPHVELVNRMKADPKRAGNAPRTGMRVSYVVTASYPGAPVYERSEDPIYVIDNDIPIDNEYYIEKQLTKPIQRIFEPILDDDKPVDYQTFLKHGNQKKPIIVEGDGATTTSETTSATAIGSWEQIIDIVRTTEHVQVIADNNHMMKFFKTRRRCAHCNNPVDTNNDVFCTRCKQSQEKITCSYKKHLDVIKEKSEETQKKYIQCMNCMSTESKEDHIKCANNDCPIFYARRSQAKKLEKASLLTPHFNQLIQNNAKMKELYLEHETNIKNRHSELTKAIYDLRIKMGTMIISSSEPAIRKPTHLKPQYEDIDMSDKVGKIPNTTKRNKRHIEELYFVKPEDIANIDDDMDILDDLPPLFTKRDDTNNKNNKKQRLILEDDIDDMDMIRKL
jgi:hypothetical protein